MDYEFYVIISLNYLVNKSNIVIGFSRTSGATFARVIFQLIKKIKFSIDIPLLLSRKQSMQVFFHCFYFILYETIIATFCVTQLAGLLAKIALLNSCVESFMNLKYFKKYTQRFLIYTAITRS